ncbi:hypothetical protein PMG11_04137 [Penicillium brasilianum]|uniref:Fe2OG dioxygenase domain-containing protein n=1 Tax=Penicillium brasilianum TaxID=104259 RepID=A0A0F7VIS1_PENBI|nr:hypothetical protein PMG11_04137 [Penicillium brasilianum]
MSLADRIPLLNLSEERDPATITSIQKALLRYGVFRLWAPDLKSAHSLELRKNAGEFFQLPLDVKARTTGYTAFDSELVRGDTPIPKESIYFFRGGDVQHNPPPSALCDSMFWLRDKWKPLKDTLFASMSDEILKSSVPLTGNPRLDTESFGINFYNPRQLDSEIAEYNPAHMDPGTLVLLIRDDSTDDGLEIADLLSTTKFGSRDIGQEAYFFPIPSNPGEVLVLVGTRLQRLLGRDKVRPCVHRVRARAPERRQEEEVRLSFTIACAASPPPEV